MFSKRGKKTNINDSSAADFLCLFRGICFTKCKIFRHTISSHSMSNNHRRMPFIQFADNGNESRGISPFIGGFHQRVYFLAYVEEGFAQVEFMRARAASKLGCKLSYHL